MNNECEIEGNDWQFNADDFENELVIESCPQCRELRHFSECTEIVRRA